MADYEFYFRCGRCGTVTLLSYKVPEESGTTKLSCKACERAVVIIESVQIWHWWNEYIEYKYKIYDCIREKWILGSESSSVSRDSFLGWVVDHNGKRFDD